jgi:hypothetical protein
MPSEGYQTRVKKMIALLKAFYSGIVPIAGVIGAVFAGLWVKKISDQKKRNTLNEIDNTAQKTNLDVHAKPIDDLVADSNKSHGADAMVKTTRDDPKKG